MESFLIFMGLFVAPFLVIALMCQTHDKGNYRKAFDREQELRRNARDSHEIQTHKLWTEMRKLARTTLECSTCPECRQHAKRLIHGED